ncbi:MAG: selenocysteine-specific translation elongation factor, partial [Acetobacteraceae bacterium]
PVAYAVIGTAGHVDHGKTTLVRALTGVDTDRLPEEKRRGITIELGFAYTDRLGFVDVPGHERLVHTMVAGAGGIDAALLVVAADDGVMPQTIEHVAILRLLGVDRGVIAVTKADLAGPDRIAEVAKDIGVLMAGTSLAPAPILSVSALTGDGIPKLKAALGRLGPRPRDTEGHARLAVDRVFTLPGAGLIVTGTVTSGRIMVADHLVISPVGNEVRVRGIHAQNRPAGVAEAGERAALNLVGTRVSRKDVNRGDWVVHRDLHAPTARLDARVTLLAGAPIPRPDTTVHVHLAAVHATARITPLSDNRLAAGADALVRLTLDRPIGALAGDRLVLRDAGATCTLGGGDVLDPFPPIRGRRTPARLAQLAALEEPDPGCGLGQLLALPPGWIDLRLYACAHNLPPPRLATVLKQAPAQMLGPLAIAPSVLTNLRASVCQLLRARHAAAPSEPGLQPERLRLALPSRPPPEAMRALLADMLHAGTITQDGQWLRLPEHRVTLSEEDERLWASVHPLIAGAPYRPPRTRDFAATFRMPEAVVRASLKRLQRAGRLIEIAPDRFFLNETVAVMAVMAAELASLPDGLTAATFRDRLDNGRKVAIQILEFFDRAGLTARQGEVRRVRADRVALFGAPASLRGA